MTTDPTAAEKLLRLVDDLNAAAHPAERRKAAVAYTRHLDLMAGAPTVEYTRDLVMAADDANRCAIDAEAEAERLRAELAATKAAAPKPDAGDEELAERFWRNLSARDPAWLPWETANGKDEIAGSVAAVIRPLLAERDARIAELTKLADTAERERAMLGAIICDIANQLHAPETPEWADLARNIETEIATLISKARRAETAEAKVAELTKPGPATDGDLCEAWSLSFDATDGPGALDVGRRAVYDLGLAHGRADAVEAALASRFNFAAFADDKTAWSLETFGPGKRTAGVLDHIRKELAEIERAPGDVSEWVDVIILAMDGAYRSAGASGQQLVEALVAKMAKNKARTWPDWRTRSENEAIEHDRSGEPAAAPSPPAPGPRYVAVKCEGFGGRTASWFDTAENAETYAANCNAGLTKFIPTQGPEVWPDFTHAVIDTRPEAGK